MVSTVSPGTTLFQYDARRDCYVEWYVVDLMWRSDGVSAILSRGDRRATVDANRLAEIVTDRENGAWVPSMYDGEDDDGTAMWIPHPNHTDAPARDVELDLRVAPDTPSALTFEKIEGRGARIEVNNFLDGAADGLVFHQLGGVAKWKAAFVARYRGAIVSAIVLHHYHPSTNGEEIAITRLANHESAPKNTSTWMIARARKWAERVGYERLATYADVDANDGTVYEAAGMTTASDPERVVGKDWKDDGDDEVWHRQKWVDHLDPDTYADKSEAWAVETVADRRWTPGRDAPVATAAQGQDSSATTAAKAGV